MTIQLIALTIIPGQYPVRLEQRDCAPRFVVTYGAQVRDFYEPWDAMAEFRHCVEHAARCNGFGD
jgi:hypothetical protein